MIEFEIFFEKKKIKGTEVTIYSFKKKGDASDHCEEYHEDESPFLKMIRKYLEKDLSDQYKLKGVRLMTYVASQQQKCGLLLDKEEG